MEQHHRAMRARAAGKAQQRVELGGAAGVALGGMGGDAQRDGLGGARAGRHGEGEEERKDEEGEPAHPSSGAPRKDARQRRARA